MGTSLPSSTSARMPAARAGATPDRHTPASYAELDRATAANDCPAVLAVLETLGEAWRQGDVNALMGCLWAVDSDASAEQLLRTAVALEPTNGVVLTDLAWMLRGQQRYAEALEVLDSAAGIQEPAFRARRSAMLLSMVTGGAVPEAQVDARWDEAGEGLVRAVQQQPRIGPAVYDATITWLVDDQDFRRGVPILEGVLGAMLADAPNIGLTPAELAGMYVRLAELLMRSGQAASAMAYLDQIASLPLESDERAHFASQRQVLVAARPGEGW